MSTQTEPTCSTLSPAAYRVRIQERIADVDAAAWDSLRRGDRDPVTHRRFLEAMETGMAGVSRFWHVLYFDDADQPVASASLCLYRVDVALLANGLIKRLVQGVRRFLSRPLEFPVLFCGLCFSAGQSNVRFAPGAQTAVVLQQLDELLLSIAARERAKCVVFKEFKPSETTALDGLLELGYQRADSLPMNHVEPIYQSFGEFVARQKSSRRYAIRKSQKKFALSGLRVEQMLGGEGADRLFTDDAYRLFETVYDRARVRLEKVTAEMFRELARKLPEQTAWTFIFQGERIVAFAVSLFTPAVYHQMFVGYDASLNAEHDLYFNLFFHAMDRAYRQNCGVIHVGQSADEFKHQKLGCHQRPLCFYIKGTDWLGRQILGRFGNAIFPPRPARADDLPPDAQRPSQTPPPTN
ncbi:MAG: GNAT family N-acetyltransferase [Planctomycetales bacterium]